MKYEIRNMRIAASLLREFINWIPDIASLRSSYNLISPDLPNYRSRE